MPIAIIVHAKYPEELDRFRVRACRLAPLTLPQEPGPDHLHLSATVTSNILSTRSDVAPLPQCLRETEPPRRDRPMRTFIRDRKSTRLNSSHLVISYAVFCLKKKIKKYTKL